MQHETRKIALFVDFDNIYLGLRETSREAAEAFATRPHVWLKWIEHGMPIGDVEHAAPRVGRALIRQCYLNPDSFGKYRGYFTRSGFTVVDCPSLTSRGKNSSDIVMVMDILDALRHETRFDRFVIMSADADFTPVLQRLRAHDRRTAVMVGGIAAPAYRASCDKLIEEDVFIEHGLELVLALDPVRGPDGATAPAFAAQAVTAIRDPDLLAAIGQRVYEEASSGGTLPASELPRILREFKEFTPSSNWLGHYSLQGLTEAILVHRPELRITDDDPWRIAVQLADEPTAAPAASDDAPPAAAEPHPDWDGLRDRVVGLVARMVDESPDPVVMGKAAQAAIQEVGPMLTSTRWLGRGTFKNLLLSAAELPFTVVASPLPGYVYDPERHQPPSERAAVDGLAELGAEMASLVRRMSQLTDAPRLTPRQYRVLWEVMAKELGRAPYNLMGTGKAVRDQCVERGEPIARQAITWVLRGLAYVGYRFEDRPHRPENLAAAYRGNLLNILRQAQVTLSDEELRTLDDWLLAAESDAPAPATARPLPPRRRAAPADPDAANEPDYAAWADAMLAGESGDRRPPPFPAEPAPAETPAAPAKADDFVWPPPDALLFEPESERPLRKRDDLAWPSAGSLFFEPTPFEPQGNGVSADAPFAEASPDADNAAEPSALIGTADDAPSVDAEPVKPATDSASVDADVAPADAHADDVLQPVSDMLDDDAPPSDVQPAHPAVEGAADASDVVSAEWQLSTAPALEPDDFPWEVASEAPSDAQSDAHPAEAGRDQRMDDGDFVPADWRMPGDSPPPDAQPDDTAHPAVEAAQEGDATASNVVEAEWQTVEFTPNSAPEPDAAPAADEAPSDSQPAAADVAEPSASGIVTAEWHPADAAPSATVDQRGEFETPPDAADQPGESDASPAEPPRADDVADGEIVSTEWHPADEPPASQADATALSENAASAPSTEAAQESSAAVEPDADGIFAASWEPATTGVLAERANPSTEAAAPAPGVPDAADAQVVTPHWEAVDDAPRNGGSPPAANAPAVPVTQIDAFPPEPPRNASSAPEVPAELSEAAPPQDAPPAERWP